MVYIKQKETKEHSNCFASFIQKVRKQGTNPRMFHKFTKSTYIVLLLSPMPAWS